jgi:hypothetical protein
MKSKPVQEAGIQFAGEKQAMPADEFLAHVDRYLGEQVARAAMTLSLPTVGEKYKLITDYNPPTIEESQMRFLNTLPGRFAQLATDANSLATVLGQRLDPKMTSFIKSVDDATNSLTQYLAKHPGAADVTVGGVAAATGFAAAASATMLIKAGLRAFGWDAAATTFGKLSGGAFLLTIGAAFQYEMMSLASDMGKAIGRGILGLLHPAGGSLPPILGPGMGGGSVPGWAFPSVFPSASSAPIAAHAPISELPIHIEHLEVKLDAREIKDMDKFSDALVMHLRRHVRSTGASTGGTGPESTATHGHFGR